MSQIRETGMKKVTPYQLATLASRIDRERCVKDPNGVLKAAVDLLRHAEYELWCAVQGDKRKEQEWEEYQKNMEETRVDWAKGTREITRERRRERAARKFTEFLKDQAPALHAKNVPRWPGNPSDYKRDGFTLAEIDAFELEFAEWKKPRKGKRGRRISESDGRLRTELVALIPTRPK
jgi:hypothetical protein